MASAVQPSELQSVIALVKTLTNAQLKDILRSETLAVSGVKATLQIRIIQHIEELVQEGRIDRYDHLRRFIYSMAQRSMPGPSTLSTPYHQYQPHSIAHSLPTQNRSSPLGIPIPSQPFTSGRLTFKDSPFYKILEPLTPAVECKVREQTRDNVELKVMLSPNMVSKLQTDSTIRVMVYCAADTGLNQYTKSDVAFPHQVELKVNLDEVKANLRGLKNKPGTTRPADITDHIRKKPGYPNQVVITYALTQKRFFVVVNLVQRNPVEKLVTELKARKTISKEQVIREMKNRAEDSDIVATSTVMSLKCPLSTLRIEVPCRSVLCTHNQCFDASSFLQLQEQAPTWTCPVCSKATSFESLQIDQYVDDILNSTPVDVDQVVIEPNGRWSSVRRDDHLVPDGGTPTTEDDELIEVGDSGSVSVKQEPLPINVSLQKTPIQSQEISTSPSVLASSKKRPAAQVIDLTGSDDDDDNGSPVRPAKRRTLNLTDGGFLNGLGNTFSSNFVNGRNHLVSGQNDSQLPSRSAGYNA